MNDQEIQKALQEIVGPSHVLVSSDTESFLIDHRRRYTGKAIAVVRPGSVEEIIKIVNFCRAHRIPIVPQGGNTGLCGGATPSLEGNAIVLTLGRLNKIRELDADNGTIAVDAGCTLEMIHEAAQKVDRLFPLDLPSEGTSQIGGALSTNAGGTAVLRYGNARDMVLGIEAVLADGRCYQAMRGLRKDNTGYDLKQLLIGSEGTLGIITGAVLKLYPRPKSHVTAWLGVKNPKNARALLDLIRSICGDRLSAFEFLNRQSIELVLKHISGTADPLRAVYPWYILAEVSDVVETAEPEELVLSALEQGVEQGLIEDAVIAATPVQAKELWRIRESMNDAQRTEGVSIKHDISIPVSKIPAFLDASEKRLTEAYPGVRIVAFGHIGDGNIHYNVSMEDPVKNKPFIKKRPEINKIVYDLVDQLGGSFSAEHGIGQLKIDELCHYRGEVAIDLMQGIKQVFDPYGILNPGKMLPPKAN